MEDTELVGIVDEVGGYVRQRAMMSTRAARMALEVGGGIDAQCVVDAAGLVAQGRALALTASVTIHPENLEFFGNGARLALRAARRLAVLTASTRFDASLVVMVISRDVETLEEARRCFDLRTPEEQDLLRRTRPDRAAWQLGAEGDVWRHLVSVPGPYLVALEADWVAAQEMLSVEYESVPSPGVALVYKEGQRTRALENQVVGLRRAMQLAAGGLQEA